MVVEHDGIDRRAQAVLGERPLDAGEGLVQRLHEQMPHDVYHQHLALAGNGIDVRAPGRASPPDSSTAAAGAARRR